MNNNTFKLSFKHIAWLITMAMFFLFDRYLKFLAITFWPNNQHDIIKNILTFNFVPNYKIAFSLPLSGDWLKIFITIILSAIFLYLLINIKKLSRLEIISYFGIILGSLSNLIDRLKYNYVIDYLDLKWFTVFNLADFLISVNVFILIIYLLKTKK